MFIHIYVLGLVHFQPLRGLFSPMPPDSEDNQEFTVFVCWVFTDDPASLLAAQLI